MELKEIEKLELRALALADDIDQKLGGCTRITYDLRNVAYDVRGIRVALQYGNNRYLSFRGLLGVSLYIVGGYGRIPLSRYSLRAILSHMVGVLQKLIDDGVEFFKKITQ